MVNKIDMILLIDLNILVEVEAGEPNTSNVFVGLLLLFECEGPSTGSCVWTLESPAGSAIWEVRGNFTDRNILLRAGLKDL